jgi:hypothetical protein
MPHKTLIGPVFTYGLETWAVGKQGENILRAFERKVIQKIFGLALENGCWRKCKNSEICKLYHEHDDVKFIKGWYFQLLCVLLIIWPDDKPLVSKHVAINTTNEVILKVFTPSTN